MDSGQRVEVKNIKRNKVTQALKHLILTIFVFGIGYLTHYFKFSISWFTTPLIVLFFQNLWKFERNAEEKIVHHSNERNFVTNQFKDEELPSWVVFPDMVSVKVSHMYLETRKIILRFQGEVLKI
jgi:hypothetical protein